MLNKASVSQSADAPESVPSSLPAHGEVHEEQVIAQHALHMVPVALLERVQQVFGFPQDRRCLNGQAFLAHWLRVAHLEQIPLVPHEPSQPVVVLTIQSLRAFCTSPLLAWPWCYDTTAKYVSVLQAAGLLLKVKQPRGMGTTYYFPLTSTPCLPVCAEQVQQLSGRRKSVRRSRALQRVSVCMEETRCPTDTHHGKEAMDVKSRSVHLSLVPPEPQGPNEQGTQDRSMQRHGDPSSKEDQVVHTVDRLVAMMQSYGMRITPAVRASMSTILWEEFIRPAELVSPQPSDEKASVLSPSRTQMSSLNEVMQNDRTMRSQKRRPSSQVVEADRRPQRDALAPEGKRTSSSDASTRVEKTSTRVEERRPLPDSSTFVEERRPGANASAVGGEGRLQPKPSTFVEEQRSLAQETVDLCDAQTQTHETHTHTRAHACAEFNHLNSSFSLKKEIIEIREDEMREQGSTNKQVDISSRARIAEEPGRPSAACSRGEMVEDPSQTLPSPAQEESSLVATHDDEADGPVLSFRDQVTAMKVAYETATHEMLEALAQDYSQRFSQSNENVGVYLKRMHEHPEWLHVAAVDALVRTWFPDPGCRAARLGGGWVIKRYRAYVEGQEEPPAEFVSWAEWMLNGGLSYNHLEWVLEAAARKGSATPGEGKRPLPHEVIIETGWLQEFWAAGGAQGLERYGYLFVDLDGEFFTLQDYERYRQAAVNEVLATPYDPSDAQVMYEIQTYLAWAESQRLPAEEEQALLNNLPRPLLQWVRALGKRIDSDHYNIGVRLAPRSRRRVIEIREKSTFGQVWHLANQQQILQWLQQYGSFPVEQ